jgi:hypothetical protein
MIRRLTNAISQEELESVFQEWERRLENCIRIGRDYVSWGEFNELVIIVTAAFSVLSLHFSRIPCLTSITHDLTISLNSRDVNKEMLFARSNHRNSALDVTFLSHGPIRMLTCSSHKRTADWWNEVVHRYDAMSDYFWMWVKSLPQYHGSSLSFWGIR